MSHHAALPRFLTRRSYAVLMTAACVAGILLPSGAAHAQVDTPAAREARAALAALRGSYGSQSTWATWSRQLGLEDVAQELQAGENAEQAVFVRAAEQLSRAAIPQFREPAFRRLAAALVTRGKELLPVPVERWRDACLEAAEGYSPITGETLERARKSVAARLDALTTSRPQLLRSTDSWSKFLYLPETRAALTSYPTNPADLDRLETRWHNALTVWGDDRLIEASLAVQSHIRLLRGYLAHESREEHAAAWRELADLLNTLPPGIDAQSLRRLGEIVNERERMAQASPLTASIRRELSRPDMILQVRGKWLETEFSQRFNEPYQINDVFAGARTVGSGRIAGRVDCNVLPSASAGQWMLRLNAASSARTTGYEDRVRVSSRATTQVRGDKQFVLGATGLSARPATATARTNIAYTNIDAEGLPRRRSEATRQTYARRPRAEADSSAMAERSTVARLDSEGRKIIADFNQPYHKGLRDPAIFAHRPVPLVRVPATPSAMRWECYAAGANFAVTAAPPQLDDSADFAIGFAASALEDQVLAAIGGRDLSGEELASALSGLLGSSGKGEQAGQDFRVAFAAWPCDVQMADGQVRARLHITSFTAADVQYPAMAVDVNYNVTEREGDLALVRDGNLRVKPLPRGEDGGKAMSGRQQTLRLAVQRRLGKVFAEELLWPRLKLPGATGERSKLRVQRATADGGWLQLALAPERT
jgi:hypothetical protein